MLSQIPWAKNSFKYANPTKLLLPIKTSVLRPNSPFTSRQLQVRRIVLIVFLAQNTDYRFICAEPYFQSAAAKPVLAASDT